MSNVLIGIIGVILFIGLALAGTIILGDDFRTSGAASKATAAMAEGKQIMDAVAMYELKTGQRFPYDWGGTRSTPSDLVPRFLRTPTTAYSWHFHSRSGGGVQAAADLVPSEQTASMCLEVQRQRGQVPQDATEMSRTSLSAAEIAARSSGCTVVTIDGQERYMLFFA